MIKNPEKAPKNQEKEFATWNAMRARCSQTNHPQYGEYGKKGFSVHHTWHSYKQFFVDVGKCPSDEHELRLIDGKKIYKKGDVIWVRNIDDCVDIEVPQPIIQTKPVKLVDNVKPIIKIKEQFTELTYDTEIIYKNMSRCSTDWCKFFNKPVQQVSVDLLTKWEHHLFNEIEKGIHGFSRDKSRIKSTGEVFTPGALVMEILDKLDISLFTDVRKTYLDPSCGSGQFLIYVLYKKLFYGGSVLDAMSSTYGVDLEQDNIDYCIERIATFLDKFEKDTNGVVDVMINNIVCHNALTYCYRFGDSSYKPLEQSIGKCQCDLCVPKQINDDVHQKLSR